MPLRQATQASGSNRKRKPRRVIRYAQEEKGKVYLLYFFLLSFPFLSSPVLSFPFLSFFFCFCSFLLVEGEKGERTPGIEYFNRQLPDFFSNHSELEDAVFDRLRPLAIAGSLVELFCLRYESFCFLFFFFYFLVLALSFPFSFLLRLR